ncbi:hypothetical protein PGT21_015475 [Puccinia graminis f. sp. tritici]|uniref:Uncharacterized protein n=1 Tax=Puccinia graminis f. sp. tritici TaxID=56615 RepID=A0A5B0MXP4_PUCGR|nr:hypothetical protein PGT21_015475 [Puccinia graminis f. sp. tritici]
MGEFWCPAEPQVDPQLIAPHLAPGYKPKAIAALAETGYSILTRSLVVYQSLATWPIAPCYQLPVCCGSSVTELRQGCDMWSQAANRTEINTGSAGDALTTQVSDLPPQVRQVRHRKVVNLDERGILW